MHQRCSWNAGTNHSPVKSEARRDVGDRLDDGESADRFHRIRGRLLTGVSAQMHQHCSLNAETHSPVIPKGYPHIPRSVPAELLASDCRKLIKLVTSFSEVQRSAVELKSMIVYVRHTTHAQPQLCLRVFGGFGLEA